MKLFFTAVLLCRLFTATSQDVVRDIRSFGAVGDGKTNDQGAFQKAADFFNKRAGHGKLTISKGTYIVGLQTFTGGKPNQPAYTGGDVMHFTNVSNFSIEGAPGSILQYSAGLRYGAFSPATGEVYEHGNNYFVNRAYMAVVGYCILLDNSNNVAISGITADGNCGKFVLGGVYGDVGRQVPHTGIYILNSRQVLINKVYIHHFGLDGITIDNTKSTAAPDSITITSSAFEYNARQGLSWVGGNQLYVKDCRFNYTGKSKFGSAPGAGVDIESEVGVVKNGVFENCEFTDNMGSGLVADSGNSSDCTFTGCTFWGTTSWAIWVTKPGFSFSKCNIYGSVVHGYSAPVAKDATTFSDCNFEDKLYHGTPVYGSFLVESNGIKRMAFTGCTFTSNSKKLVWFSSPATAPEEKYQLNNCSFIINNSGLPQGNVIAMIRGVAMKNCTFTFTDPEAKPKRYLLAGYSEASNTDLGGNKIAYKNQ
jgi:Right handed beta helix region